jgi:hypothetical protein
MRNIERCWIWTTRDAASGQVSRGVMFHEPEASRAWLSVDEFVRAEQLRGAAGERDRYKPALDRLKVHPLLTRAAGPLEQAALRIVRDALRGQ